ILSPKAEISSYVAAGWLSCIAANLVLNKDYDVAVRDINMAIGAFVLGRLCAAREHRIEQDEFAARQELAA
ncbi:MAG: hypothetical protein JOZ44_11725, partial [Acidobacteria bacterium]|nr:hypothetical protein [Acidobacteriota bacterium]